MAARGERDVHVRGVWVIATRGRGDRGGASVIALAVVVVTVLLGVAVIAAAGLARARIEAQHGADAAALAGAHAARGAVAQGVDAQAEGCEAARRTGAVLGVRVERCVAQGAVVTVAVSVDGHDAPVVAVAGPDGTRAGR